jgi:hypothetical protein
MFICHRLLLADKLDFPHAVGTEAFSGTCLLQLSEPQWRSFWDRTAPLKPKDGLNGPPSYFLVSFTRAKEVSLPPSSLSMSQLQVSSLLL